MMLWVYFTTKEDTQGKSYDEASLLMDIEEAGRDIIREFFYNDTKTDLTDVIIDQLKFHGVEFQRAVFDGFTFDEIASFECEFYDCNDWESFDRRYHERIATGAVYTAE